MRPVRTRITQILNLAAILISGTTALAEDRRDASTVARQIDAVIEKSLADGKHATAPAAEDAEFLRRAYLDLHGVIPTAEAVIAFENCVQHVSTSKRIPGKAGAA